jgi:DNA/RNA endonuclease YhcR with UshA esterase domain
MDIMLTLLTYEPVGHLNNRSHTSGMLERQERVAMVLLLGVVIAVITAHLILGSLGKHPFATTFSNNSADGELVRAGGTIDQLVVTRTGGHLNVYTDTVTIFVPAQVAGQLMLERGDAIAVYGVVQTYRGKKEIVVSSAQDVSVIPLNTRFNSSATS